MCSFVHDTRAYIPFAVIGIFVLLFSITSSFYLMKMDYELAETIYQTDGISMEKAAEDIASADLARCLNYAGMQALKWQGEHPIIKSEGTTYEEWGEDRFSVFSKSKDAEPGETIEVNVKLPSNILEAIVNIFSAKPRTLIVKGSSGTVYEKIVYDETHSFWSKSEFNEMITIPENATDEYGYLILMYGNDTKATNWFHMGTNPVKDITAHHFNRFLQSNYQRNVHTFNNYAINVVPDVQPSQIEIGKINGTLSRQLERSQGDDYTIYYTLTIKDLNYTLVDLSTGTSVNRSMDISTLVTSREPLLAQLTTEYEQALSSRTNSDVVLGATNIRTFTYGPWQHYLNGPLNIVTGPALTSSVNAGTLYTQKRVFDSVDPWAAAYTTYYNGKVLYTDISRDSSGYEDEKQSNINTSYANLSSTGSFNVDIDKGINESMADASTSREEVANNSKLIVSVSNYTDSVYYGWVYNDDKWSRADPDLLHDVTREVYSATIQGQVFRDGFDEPQIISDYGGYGSHGSTSASGHTVTWKGYYPVLVTHTRALGDNFTYTGTVLYHSAKLSTGKSSWSLTGATVSHIGTDVTCTNILATYNYIGNDALLNETRVDGYLENEKRSFDWKVTYIMDFEVESEWDIDYSFDYTSTCYENVNGTLVPYPCTRSSSGSDTVTLVNSGKASHTQTETENITIIYHQYLPSGGYSGVTRNYSPGSSYDYRNTTVSLNGLERPDTDCSDAADKYRDQYVIPNMLSIQSQYLAYPDEKELSVEKVYCDIPDWLHKVMAEEMHVMFDSITGENPTREVPLLGKNLGKDPTLLIQDAAFDIVAEMDDSIKKEAFAKQDQHFTGTMYTTSSDAARAIARSEAYDQLLKYIVERNQNDTSAFGAYVDEAFSKKQGSSLSLLLGGDSSLLFNNPAMQKASTALAREMGVIGTMTITGEPQSKYNWTENMTLLIDQYPDYLYHDPGFDLQTQYMWEDELSAGKVLYPLGVRNVCVFSTGIGADIAEILENSMEPLKDSISQSMSQSISEMNTEVNSLIEDIGSESAALIANGTSADTTLIQENRTRLMTNYSASIRSQVPDMVADEVANDPVLSTLISKSEVRTITDSYISTLSDDELVSMVADNTLQEEILLHLNSAIVSENPLISSDEMEAITYRLEADLRIGIANGVSEAIILSQAVIDECFANINGELQKMLDDSTEKLTGQLAKKMEQRLQRAMKYVPCGLPVLPPNWVCTVNVWEYEVIGKYKMFKVIDNDNECMFNPYLGHEAQIYVRKYDLISHPFKKDISGNPIWIGSNEPIKFRFSGYAATIVGPGPKGVGDKISERDEKSEGYNDLLTEWVD
ncbi:hypothetical protein Mpsy_3116 [Methanolobus psychrophilus R15]|nr:hypothetical protein Mpsy_3116 [Methanolobus psychrophilus R15]